MIDAVSHDLDTFRLEDGVPYVGRRAVRWAIPRVEGFFRGFHARFESGLTLSVQWGAGSYSTNRHTWEGPLPEARTAEIAVWLGDGERWVALTAYDDVRGYCSPDFVSRVIDMLAEPGMDFAKFSLAILGMEDS